VRRVGQILRPLPRRLQERAPRSQDVVEELGAGHPGHGPQTGARAAGGDDCMEGRGHADILSDARAHSGIAPPYFGTRLCPNRLVEPRFSHIGTILPAFTGKTEDVRWRADRRLAQSGCAAYFSLVHTSPQSITGGCPWPRPQPALCIAEEKACGRGSHTA